MVQPARIELRVDRRTSRSQEPPLQPEGGLAVSATAKVHGGENTRDDSVDEIVRPGTVSSEEEDVITNLNINIVTSHQSSPAMDQLEISYQATDQVSEVSQVLDVFMSSLEGK